MKKLIFILLILLSTNQALAVCGYVPPKPFTPYGCNDLVAVCVCDSNGQGCRWVWVCE